MALITGVKTSLQVIYNADAICPSILFLKLTSAGSAGSVNNASHFDSVA